MSKAHVHQKRTQVSFENIQREIQQDWDYANAWYANLAMAYYDAGEVPDIATANKAAGIFMERTFKLDMKKFHKTLEDKHNGM